MAESIEKSIKNAANTFNSFPEDTPIYLFFGHGTEECDDNGNLIEEIVPYNCVYITIVECGSIAKHFEDINNFFSKKSSQTDFILRYPQYEINKKKIASSLHVEPDNIHIHLPGTKYVKSNFVPLSHWDTPYYFKITYSGFVNKKEFSKRDQDIYKDFYLFKINLSDLGINSLEKATFFDTLLDKIDKSTSPYKSNLIQQVREKLQSTEHTIQLVTEQFPKKNVLSKEDIETFLNKNVYTIEKQRLLEYFSGSLFPQSKVLDKYLFPSNENIYIKDVFSILEEKALQNTILMDTYPGIHYNIVCRSVGDNCKQSATLRRSASTIGKQLQQEETGKRSPTFESILHNVTKLKNLPLNHKNFNSLFKKIRILQPGHNLTISDIEDFKHIFKSILEKLPNIKDTPTLLKLYDALMPYDEVLYTIDAILYLISIDIDLYETIQSLPAVKYRLEKYFAQLDKQDTVEKSLEDKKGKEKEFITLIHQLNNTEFEKELITLFRSKFYSPEELEQLKTSQNAGKRKTRKTRRKHYKSKSRKYLR